MHVVNITLTSDCDDTLFLLLSQLEELGFPSESHMFILTTFPLKYSFQLIRGSSHSSFVTASRAERHNG